MKRRIGFFGGTFDPIHFGHLTIAENAQKQLKLDQIIFLPSGIPPHKTKQILTDKNIRRKMVEEAIAPFPAYSFSGYDLNKSTPCYTIEMLRYFKRSKLGKNSQFYFLMGEDSLINFATWYEADKISQYTVLAVYPRVNQNLLGTAFLKQDDFISINSPIIKISSTEIRDRVCKGDDISGLVPAVIQNIIEEYNLYKNK
ncbi:MAG: nicotinate (nicotinamide) nucleotide adenylyltransferase [Calditrichaeota bacterium]|nr:MAG: nicotinate (nicotinamide) nucleotide adenylyltransferase [Calditrichota bacterium]